MFLIILIRRFIATTAPPDPLVWGPNKNSGMAAAKLPFLHVVS